MEKSPDLVLGFTDSQVNELIRNLPQNPGKYSLGFSAEEDLFLRFDTPLSIPSFQIHHRVAEDRPSEAYLTSLKSLITEVAVRCPAAFSQLTWFFDPRDIFRPGFYQVLGFKDRKYLYSLKLDISFKPRDYEIVVEGTNDASPVYRTNTLFFESEIYSVESMNQGPLGQRHFFLKKLFEQTWKGESGRGYLVTGQWLDHEITKFISRAFLPPGKKTHPYYPFKCKMNTLVYTLPRLSLEGRKLGIQNLSQGIESLGPDIAGVPHWLKDQDFHEDMPEYQALRSRVNPELSQRISRYEIKSYLNDLEQKEYSYHGELV